jgi:endonuclease III
LLRRFPSIGEPGAAKIVLFSGIVPRLTFDSNGVRVLLRIGLAPERPSYATNYRALVRALEPEIPATFDARIELFQLLKRHGQELCKREQPRCGLCPVAADCSYISVDR